MGLQALCAVVDCKVSIVGVTLTSQFESETSLLKYIAALRSRKKVAITFLTLSSVAGSRDLLWVVLMLVRNMAGNSSSSRSN